MSVESLTKEEEPELLLSQPVSSLALALDFTIKSWMILCRLGPVWWIIDNNSDVEGREGNE